MLTILESKRHNSAFSKLFSQIKYGLTQRMDKNTQQKFEEIIKNEAHILEIE